jgi:hypothetical protein
MNLQTMPELFNPLRIFVLSKVQSSKFHPMPTWHAFGMPALRRFKQLETGNF